MKPDTITVCYWVILSVSVCHALRQVRVEDKPFPRQMTILDRYVTCGDHKPGKFPSPTWSCNDLKVDGHRLIFTYFPGPGASKIECGEELGRNDLAQLCRDLLQTQGVKHKLWSAYVSKASCGRSELPRMYYMKNDSYIWHVEDEEERGKGKGYIISLQCTILD